MHATEKFDSEAFYQRLLRFAKRCLKLVSKLPKTQYNLEYGNQLIRASASPGSNYIEALEALGKKDFVHRLRFSRKETRESVHWLMLIEYANSDLSGVDSECQELIKEGREIVKILTSSIITLEKKNL